MAEGQDRIAALEAEIARLRAENERLKAIIEELHRGHKRQAAPFSKGPPKPDPKPPGRKAGDDYGTVAFLSQTLRATSGHVPRLIPMA